MPFICYKIGNYDPSLPQDLPNYPHCGYISIDGCPFKKLYYGAVFEVTAGEHSVVCSNDPTLDPKACAKRTFLQRSIRESELCGFAVFFSQNNIYTIYAKIAAQPRHPVFQMPIWWSMVSDFAMQETCSGERLSKFYNTTITDGYAYLSQRATHLSGPISRKTVMEEAEREYAKPAQTPTPKAPPAYTPSVVKPQSTYDSARELRRKRRKRKKLLKKIAIGIACAAVASLILWWLIDTLEPLFSEIAENLHNME